VASSGTEKLALLAGKGILPVMVASAAVERGYSVEAFGFEGMVDSGLEQVCQEVHTFPFLRLNSLYEKILDQGIKKAVTIGGIAHASVLDGMPSFDDLALEMWKKLPDRRVDSIMEALIEELARKGVEVLEVIGFLTDNLAPRGALTKRKPSRKEWEDISFGFEMAKAIGGLDMGQTVVIKHRAVMAAEAVEGTDQAIRRGGELAREGAVVVKVAKPGQDLRFDVPAVGVDTLDAMADSGCSVLAVETGMVLMVDREAMVDRADRDGMCIVGLTGQQAKDRGKKVRWQAK